MLKWKWVKVNGQRVREIRARLTVRGFKDVQGQDLSAFAGTASRAAQRLLTSEAVLRGWDIVSADVPKAFLQGISYADLAEQTGEPLREVCFTVPPATAAELRKIPGFETFVARMPDRYPPEAGYAQGMAQLELEEAPRITQELLRRGYAEKEIRGILGENWLRVCGEVWR